MASHSLISITGLTASGKTTIGRLLANELNYHFIEEEWSDNPYLEDFNNGRGSFFDAEIWFIERDFKRLELAMQKVGEGVGVVIDKPIYENYTYIQFAPMSESEKDFCRDLIHQKSCSLGCPDVLIDIKADPDLILERIFKRNRKIEISLTREWFEVLLQTRESCKHLWPVMPTIPLVAGEMDFLSDPGAIGDLIHKIETCKKQV